MSDITLDRDVLRRVVCLATLIDDVGEDEHLAREQAIALLDDAVVPDDQQPVMAAKRWPSNAHLIADVARLGWLDGHVVDVTYGKHGGFWKIFEPARFTRHDLRHLDGVDFRALPHRDDTFDTGVIDGPYKLNGTDTDEMAERFGVDERASVAERHLLICDGIRELGRVIKLGGFLLVKCQDQVCNGVRYFQTDIFTRAAEDAGFTKIEVFYFVGHHRPQPMDGREQKHAHGSPSVLLVFRKDVDVRQQTLDLDGPS